LSADKRLVKIMGDIFMGRSAEMQSSKAAL